MMGEMGRMGCIGSGKRRKPQTPANNPLGFEVLAVL